MYAIMYAFMYVGGQAGRYVLWRDVLCGDVIRCDVMLYVCVFSFIL